MAAVLHERAGRASRARELARRALDADRTQTEARATRDAELAALLRLLP